MFKIIKKALFSYRVERAIKQANKLHKLTKQRFLVVMWGGKPHVFAKQDLKRMQRQKIFNVPYQVLQSKAIYKTPLG
ncbi:MAG: hypothetical protein LBO06_02485 [Bacteroidales bacterium]|nr:hypothetical protein [Bacteroidales bacterium]